jgi:hypothetical protein
MANQPILAAPNLPIQKAILPEFGEGILFRKIIIHVLASLKKIVINTRFKLIIYLTIHWKG